MESAFSTNTGNKRPESLLAMALRQAGSMSQYLGLVLKNRAFNTTISGTVVAAGTTMAVAAFTPKYTGKARVSWFASWAAPGAGVVTPVLQYAAGGTTVIAAFAQRGNIASGCFGVQDFFLTAPLTLGTLYGIGLATSAGDHAITLGQGVSTAGAGILIEELL